MKDCILILLAMMCLTGCESQRISYRYGNGEPYRPKQNAEMLRKVCLHALSFFDEEKTRIHHYDNLCAEEPSVSDIVSYASDILTDKKDFNTMSIEVAVRFQKTTPAYSHVLESVACFLPTVPFVYHHKREAVVEIRELGKRELLSSSVLVGCYSKKFSVLLFLGAIPFGSLEGYQENVIDYEYKYETDNEGQIKLIRPVKLVNAFNRALAHCIAEQLQKDLSARLMIPDVDFDEGGAD